ncbi:MAG: inorganic phosphate transporter [Gemmatimonadota bacterium]|nr:MAG: inorganic phosphate transporter [Gemmatimonadota bacterium]
MVTLVIFTVLVAFAFDFVNGFHDSANSIATVVSTRVLTPLQAVSWAAFWNFVAAFTFGTAVAKTVGSGLIDLSIVDPWVVLAGLLGAILWDLITWYWGLPSSSSHALLGGYAGAAIAKAGVGSLIFSGWIKPVAAIAVSPLLGFLLASILGIASLWVVRNSRPGRVDRWFRRLQLVSSAAFSFSHGSNDAQKTMGIIVGLLASSNALFAGVEGPLRFLYLPSPDHVPRWVILGAHAAIALGTLFGGWRIVRTMGTRITQLRPIGGFAAETGGASSILVASFLGVPVSTTHTISGAIMGVGAIRRASAVRWGVAGEMLVAWILTIPASAFAAGAFYWLAHLVRLTG